jgi:hypothetical protein
MSWSKTFSVQNWARLMTKYQRECYDTNEKKYKYFFTSKHPDCDLKIALSFTTLKDIEKVGIAFDNDSGWYSVKVYHKDSSADNWWTSVLDFHFNDGHFGSFLWDNFGEEGKEKEEMANTLDEMFYNGTTNNTTGLNTIATSFEASFGDGISSLSDTIASIKNYTNDISWGYTDSVSNIETKEEYVKLEDFYKVMEKLENKVDKKENKTEEKGMNFKLDFGKLNNTSNIGLSIKGVCVKNAEQNWVAYDAETKEVINVNGFMLEKGNEYLYKMPVALKNIKKGDMLIHNNIGVFVEEINTEEGTEKIKSLVVVSPAEGEVREILPIKNMFNFEYMTKVVNVFEMFGEKPNADSPFGNMLPFLMMKDGAKNIKDIILMQTMMKQENSSLNPMMLMLLGDDNKSIDPMVLMMMNNMNK